jgi:lipopolysaccharide O-acetyltransferase
MRGRRTLGHATIGGYRLWKRAVSKAFSLAAAGGFAAFGRSSVLELPVRQGGAGRIAIGRDVFVGAGSWLQAIGGHGTVAIEVGDGTSIAGNCVISAVSSVRLGMKVLVARNVYIADHSHAYRNPTLAVLEQGVDQVAAVEVCDGAWLGENVVICPGVRIGRGAVIGANAVVTADVPDHAVAVGAPARVVREFAVELNSAA